MGRMNALVLVLAAEKTGIGLGEAAVLAFIGAVITIIWYSMRRLFRSGR